MLLKAESHGMVYITWYFDLSVFIPVCACRVCSWLSSVHNIDYSNPTLILQDINDRAVTSYSCSLTSNGRVLDSYDRVVTSYSRAITNYGHPIPSYGWVLDSYNRGNQLQHGCSQLHVPSVPPSSSATAQL